MAFAVWTYRKRELPVPGRWGLAVARSATLVLALLLLFDPRLPWGGPSGELPWVLVDASASMAVGSDGATPWDSASSRAQTLRAEGARVLRFGDDPSSSPDDSGLGGPPTEPRSLLVPALERAAEAGARDVAVLSDFRLEDPVGVRTALQRLGLTARFETVGAEARNAGIAALTLPADVDAGDSVAGDLTVFATGVGETDSLRVEVREEERLVWSGFVPAPTVGRVVRVPLELAPPLRSGGGEVRYRVIVSLSGDMFAADDEAVAYTLVDPREGTLGRGVVHARLGAPPPSSGAGAGNGAAHGVDLSKPETASSPLSRARRGRMRSTRTRWLRGSRMQTSSCCTD